MRPEPGEYNPLDYANLTRGCVEELMRRGPYPLAPSVPFAGAGVYALFYRGRLPVYAPIRSPDAVKPIYVGKAVPPGARKGGPQSGEVASTTALHSRLTEHARSIEQVSGLVLADFQCRYLVVTPLWITMAERFLIEHYRPVWNVCLDGFGNHDPGAGRHRCEVSWWDALHPGRSWATHLRPTRTAAQARERVRRHWESMSVP